MLRTSILGLSVCALTLGAAAHNHAAHAAANVKTGMLTCNVAAGWGYVIGSSRKILCMFSNASMGRTEYYTGKISKVGIDLGFVRGGSMTWAVFTPNFGSSAGALAGTYIGATAGAAIGLGGSVNALVGGQANSISLQPLSTVGNKGLNLAAGMETLNLKYQPLYPNILK